MRPSIAMNTETFPEGIREVLASYAVPTQDTRLHQYMHRYIHVDIYIYIDIHICISTYVYVCVCTHLEKKTHFFAQSMLTGPPFDSSERGRSPSYLNHRKHSDSDTYACSSSLRCQPWAPNPQSMEAGCRTLLTDLRPRVPQARGRPPASPVHWSPSGIEQLGRDRRSSPPPAATRAELRSGVVCAKVQGLK